MIIVQATTQPHPCFHAWALLYWTDRPRTIINIKLLHHISHIPARLIPCYNYKPFAP
uniref:Uncharacterized protein n=1 Tax=Arundo donax TaxID=35708 RepID=A0A0A9G7G8_ARUDO